VTITVTSTYLVLEIEEKIAAILLHVSVYNSHLVVVMSEHLQAYCCKL